MTIKIWSYTITNDDETDILENTLNSVSRVPVDKIILVDSGTQKALIHHQRLFTPVLNWMESRTEFEVRGSEYLWNGVSLVLLEERWTDPAHMRNFTLRWIESQPDRPDWIIGIDSDEFLSLEAERKLRGYLESLPPQVTNVVQPLLNLIQDDAHCAAGHHSTWLSHARIHRCGTDKVWYTGSWHEHEMYTGERVQWPHRLIHTRMLFRRRLYLQRGHPTLHDAWSDIQMTTLPNDVGVPYFEWPEDEPRVPFDEDVRAYMGGKASDA